MKEEQRTMLCQSSMLCQNKKFKMAGADLTIWATLRGQVTQSKGQPCALTEELTRAPEGALQA